jgi:hypothetical protein
MQQCNGGDMGGLNPDAFRARLPGRRKAGSSLRMPNSAIGIKNFQERRRRPRSLLNFRAGTHDLNMLGGLRWLSKG